MSTDDDLNRLSTMPADEALLELARGNPVCCCWRKTCELGNLGNMPGPEISPSQHAHVGPFSTQEEVRAWDKRRGR